MIDDTVIHLGFVGIHLSDRWVSIIDGFNGHEMFLGDLKDTSPGRDILCRE